MRNRLFKFLTMLLTVIALGSGATVLNLSIQKDSLGEGFDFHNYGSMLMQGDGVYPEAADQKLPDQKLPVRPQMVLTDGDPGNLAEINTESTDTIECEAGNARETAASWSMQAAEPEGAERVESALLEEAMYYDGDGEKISMAEEARGSMTEAETAVSEDGYDTVRGANKELSFDEDMHAYYARLQDMEKVYTARMNAAAKESLAVQQTVAESLLESWDDELNAIYQKLRDVLPEDEFISLRNEERAWIRSRDEAANKVAARQNYSNSTQNLAYTCILLEWTKARVYELAQMYYGE